MILAQTEAADESWFFSLVLCRGGFHPPVSINLPAGGCNPPLQLVNYLKYHTIK